MSTYSNLSIELIGTGEQDGTWGTTTNTNLGTALEEAIVGTTDLVVTTGTNTPAWSTSSNASQIPRHLRINLTGSAGGTGDLVVPTLTGGKNYIIKNSSDTTITVKTTSGSGIVVPIGTSMSLYQDGTNVVVTDSHHTGAGAFTTLSASSTVSGTGFTARFASPGPIGNTSASTGAFTTLTTTGNVTLGDASADEVTHNAQTVNIPNNLIYSGTGAITQAVGTTAQRPGSPAEGMFRYNSTTDEFEGYADGAWGSIGGGASSSVVTVAFNEFVKFAGEVVSCANVKTPSPVSPLPNHLSTL